MDQSCPRFCLTPTAGCSSAQMLEMSPNPLLHQPCLLCPAQPGAVPPQGDTAVTLRGSCPQKMPRKLRKGFVGGSRAEERPWRSGLSPSV